SLVVSSAEGLRGHRRERLALRYAAACYAVRLPRARRARRVPRSAWHHSGRVRNLPCHPSRRARLEKELAMSVSITLIGGPTALIEFDGFRLLTDPTFDAPGAYQLPHVKLEKLTGPAFGADKVGEVDAVLLSHDQHSDNLDNSGRDFLKKVKRVLTTEAGAKRLGGHAEGFAPWASTTLKGRNGHTL